MNLTARIGPRGFGVGDALPAGVTLAVTGYTWSAMGGPAGASITANGSQYALSRLLDVLRCPVEIRAETGELAWWGYVQAVSIQDGGAQYGASLAGMFNSVRVAYSWTDPDAGGSERRTYPDVDATALQDAASTAMYGVKDALVSIGTATDDAATAAAARILATFRYPQAALDLRDYAGGRQAVITCAGWYDTLDWRYYRSTSTGSSATTDIIADIVTATGQFFAGTYLATASGLDGPDFRDGDTTAGAEVAALLAQGTSGSLPLWPTVGSDRWLTVQAEPTSTAYRLRSDGTLLTDTGTPVPVWRPVVGVWCGMADILPVIADLSGLVDVTRRFITEWEWRQGAARPALTFRGQPSLKDIAGVANR